MQKYSNHISSLPLSAQFLGGILQASLTVFGVIGGPLFGLFTLGMFSTTANQRGAISGVLTGLAFAMWLGFGQPKPPLKMLEFSVEGCVNDPTLVFFTDPKNMSFKAAQLTDVKDDSDYFYLYRISYMWYGVLGALVTFGVGWAVSKILNLLNMRGHENESIYLDENRNFLNPDLFSPPIANRLRLKYAKYVEAHGPDGMVQVPKLSAQYEFNTKL